MGFKALAAFIGSAVTSVSLALRKGTGALWHRAFVPQPQHSIKTFEFISA